MRRDRDGPRGRLGRATCCDTSLAANPADVVGSPLPVALGSFRFSRSSTGRRSGTFNDRSLPGAVAVRLRHPKMARRSLGLRSETSRQTAIRSHGRHFQRRPADRCASPSCLTRNGVRYRPTIFVAGHQGAWVLNVCGSPSLRAGDSAGTCPSAAECAGQDGTALGSIEMPIVAAIISAAASACSHAMPAVPDREGRHVAGGVDVLEADNSTVIVDSDEPVGVARNPWYPRALEPCHRDNTVRLDRAAGCSGEGLLRRSPSPRRRDELDRRVRRGDRGSRCPLPGRNARRASSPP